MVVVAENVALQVVVAGKGNVGHCREGVDFSSEDVWRRVLLVGCGSVSCRNLWRSASVSADVLLSCV